MGMRNPTAAYRELGGALRRLRMNAGLTGAELAKQLAWPALMVSRMETGKRDSTTTEVIQYAVQCGLTLPEAEPILDLARIAERQQGYWLSDKRIGNSLRSLIFHEAAAEHSIIYEPQLINGLLQRPAYARAVIAAIEPSLTADEVDGTVETRIQRQQIMHWENPARFTFFVSEQALRLRVGDATIMHEQLLHLVLTSALDNVTMRIVPSAAGERSAFGGPFRLMEHEHGRLVYLDHAGGGGLLLEDRNYVKTYLELVPMLMDVALDEGQSREFAANLADEYDRGSQPDVAHRLEEEQLQRNVGQRLRGSGLAEEQLQRRGGERLCRSGFSDPTTPIYEG